MEKSVVVSQKIFKKRITICPTISLLGIEPKEWKARTRTDACTSSFTTALFAKAKKLVSIDGRMEKQHAVYTSNGIVVSLKKDEP